MIDRKEFTEILGSEIISTTGGVVAGSLLLLAIDKIYLVPGLFILLPGFLEMRGNISGSLSARLSSGLILHAFNPNIKKNKIVKGNLIASMILVIIVSLALGFVTYVTTWYFFNINNINIIFIALIAGVLSNIIEVPLTVVTTFWLYRHGHDPQNIMGPYITTTGDIISVVSLLIAIVMI